MSTISTEYLKHLRRGDKMSESNKSGLTEADLREIIEAIQKAYEQTGRKLVIAELYGPDGEHKIILDNRDTETLN